jgi:transcriptional antiterminator RfaH
VKFGQEPAKVHDELIGLIKSRELLSNKVVPLFTPGQILQIKEGPFAGLEAVYNGIGSEQRVIVLLELMSKPVKLMLELHSVKQVS